MSLGQLQYSSIIVSTYTILYLDSVYNKIYGPIPVFRLLAGVILQSEISNAYYNRR